MDLKQQYHTLLLGLENLVACEAHAISTENWAALSEALRLKQSKLQELAVMKSRVDSQSPEILETVHRIADNEANACHALELKLEEAHRATSASRTQPSSERLETVKEIVNLHKGQTASVRA
jgi:selenophosphate synthase